MSKIVRIRRDNGRIITRMADGYVAVDLATLETETSGELKPLMAGGSWVPFTGDPKPYAAALEVAHAAGTSLSVKEEQPDPKERTYRVPGSVKSQALDALSWLRDNPTEVNPSYINYAATLTAAPTVTTTWVNGLHTTYTNTTTNSTNTTIEYKLLGGSAGERWAARVLGVDPALVSSAFVYSPEATYLAGGDDPMTTAVNRLYKIENGECSLRRNGSWEPADDPTDPLVIELDPESATSLATWVDDTQPDDPGRYFELRSILPIEYNLYELAEPEIDWEMIDRVELTAAGVWDQGRAPQERSETAQRQQRNAGGEFAPGSPNEKGDELYHFAKARIAEELPKVDPIETINAYLLSVDEQRSGAASGAMQAAAGSPSAPAPETDTVDSSTPESTDVRPMYAAIVDEADANAVLDIIAIGPAKAGTGQGPSAWRRANGTWESAPDLLADLQGTTPPPTVELKDDNTVKQVLSQVDAHDQESPDKQDGESTIAASGDPTARSRKMAAKKGHAMKDGSFPINDAEDLKKAVRAIGRAKDQAAARRHIKKRARALKRTDLIPDEWKSASAIDPLWGPDGEQLPLTAAGVPAVADTPGDVRNAERLKRYWTHGEGAAKIGWGTGGDWYRCVSHLSKYMGTRAKGYCTLRHKDATGAWPGQAPGERGLKASGDNPFAAIQFEQSLYAMGLTAALAANAELEAPLEPYDLELAPPLPDDGFEGGAFVIPMLLPETIESGDGRKFESQSVTLRDLPLPLLWQVATGNGHDGAFIVGRIDSIERTANGVGRAVGVFDIGPFGREAERLVRAKMLRGVSADLDMFEASTDTPDEAAEAAEAPAEQIKNEKITVSQARVMAATLVPKPAFQECYIMMADDDTHGPVDGLDAVEDGIYEEQPSDAESAEILIASLAASAAPVHPPKSWFNDPGLDKPTPITVDDEGRVFGHIATWETSHIGLPRRTNPPRSASNYAYFRTGVLRTDDGDDVTVGQLTLAGGHASMTADAAAAVKHYDDTASAVADVSAGEDRHGIWVAGALRPSVTPEQVRVLRASAPSGDWRPINGRLELVAVCQVNVPGFPVARVMVAGGQVQALVAAGARHMAELREHPMVSLEARIDALESERLTELRAAALARLAPQRRARDEALVAAATAARERMSPLVAKREEERAALVAAAQAARERIGRTTNTESDDSNF